MAGFIRALRAGVSRPGSTGGGGRIDFPRNGIRRIISDDIQIDFLDLENGTNLI